MRRCPAACLAIIVLLPLGVCCQTIPGEAIVKNLSPDEAKARVKRLVLPLYPEAEKRAALTRTVEIGLEILPSGETNDLRVLSGDPALTSAAWDGIRQWIFNPVAESDAKVTARTRLLVRFKTDGTIEILAVRPRLADSFGDPGAPATALNTPFAMISGVRKPGVDGVTYPSCISCPEPQFTEQARRNNVSGTVVLEAVITEAGTASNIRVVQTLGYGLEQSAIEAVQKWRFKPALDTQGKPVDTVTMLEITFRLLRNPTF